MKIPVTWLFLTVACTGLSQLCAAQLLLAADKVWSGKILTKSAYSLRDGHADESIRLLQPYMTVLKQKGPADDYVKALSIMAQSALQTGKTEDAEKLFIEALRFEKSRRTSSQSQIARLSDFLAKLYLDQEKYSDALKYLSASYQIKSQLLGASSAVVKGAGERLDEQVVQAYNAALRLFRNKNYKEACSTFDALIPLCKNKDQLILKHDAMYLKARSLQLDNQWQKSKTAYRDLLNSQSDIESGILKDAEAAIRELEGKSLSSKSPESDAQLVQKNFQFPAKILPDDPTGKKLDSIDTELKAERQNLEDQPQLSKAESLYHQKKYKEASGILEALVQKHTPGSGFRRKLLLLLGEVEFEENELQRAEKTFKQVLAEKGSGAPIDGWQLAVVQRHLWKIQALRSGQKADTDMLEQAVHCLAEDCKANPFDLHRAKTLAEYQQELLAAKFEIADNLFLQKRFKDSIPEFRSILASQDDVLKPTMRRDCLYLLGRALSACKSFSESENILKQLIREESRTDNEPAWLYAGARCEISGIYKEQKQERKSLEWLQNAVTYLENLSKTKALSVDDRSYLNGLKKTLSARSDKLKSGGSK
ncbi:MAG: tetratricopeptide repeat protein [Candidatus Obscuribacterales bacterium]|nr:tetratricopeptide repeat protein [Candidatus Obscuribacterales bacterium]